MGRKSKKQQLEASQLAPAEAAVPAVAPASANEPKRVDFDAWYAMRAARIPKHHHKEIIKADFKARGLQQQESVKDFDAALEKYGVKLG